MFGPRIFRNRWAALGWAAGVVWFAYDVASDAPHARPAATAKAQVDATGAPVSAADLAALANTATP